MLYNHPQIDSSCDQHSIPRCTNRGLGLTMATPLTPTPICKDDTTYLILFLCIQVHLDMLHPLFKNMIHHLYHQNPQYHCQEVHINIPLSSVFQYFLGWKCWNTLIILSLPSTMITNLYTYLYTRGGRGGDCTSPYI